MFSFLKHRAAAFAAAGLISLLSLAPAVAQGTYPGSYMGSTSQAQGSYSTSSQGMTNSSGMSYSSPGASYGPVSARVGDGDNDADDRVSANGSLYRIVFGDTLSRIALRFHVTVFDLLRANPSIRNPNLIFAGRFLVIPGRGSAGSAYSAPSYGGNAGAGSASYGSAGASGGSMSGAYGAPAESPGEYGTPAPTAMPPMTMPTPMPMQTPAPGPTAAPTPAPGRQTVNINLTARNFAFSMSSITVPAGSHVVVHFTNQDAAPHNFAVYTNSAAQQAIFRGQIITGPNATMTYEFDAPAQPGTFFFRCDVHPTIMNGQFMVQ